MAQEEPFAEIIAEAMRDKGVYSPIQPKAYQSRTVPIGYSGTDQSAKIDAQNLAKHEAWQAVFDAAVEASKGKTVIQLTEESEEYDGRHISDAIVGIAIACGVSWSFKEHPNDLVAIHLNPKIILSSLSGAYFCIEQPKPSLASAFGGIF